MLVFVVLLPDRVMDKNPIEHAVEDRSEYAHVELELKTPQGMAITITCLECGNIRGNTCKRNSVQHLYFWSYGPACELWAIRLLDKSS